MTINQWVAMNPEVDGRIQLPSDRWDPAGERWLVPELTDFGTTIYTYCEENSDCIVEDVVGTTLCSTLRILMWQEKNKYRDPLDNTGDEVYSNQVDDEPKPKETDE